MFTSRVIAKSAAAAAASSSRINSSSCHPYTMTRPTKKVEKILSVPEVVKAAQLMTTESLAKQAKAKARRMTAIKRHTEERREAARTEQRKKEGAECMRLAEEERKRVEDQQRRLKEEAERRRREEEEAAEKMAAEMHRRAVEEEQRRLREQQQRWLEEEEARMEQHRRAEEQARNEWEMRELEQRCFEQEAHRLALLEQQEMETQRWVAHVVSVWTASGARSTLSPQEDCEAHALSLRDVNTFVSLVERHIIWYQAVQAEQGRQVGSASENYASYEEIEAATYDDDVDMEASPPTTYDDVDMEASPRSTDDDVDMEASPPSMDEDVDMEASPPSMHNGADYSYIPSSFLSSLPVSESIAADRAIVPACVTAPASFSILEPFSTSEDPLAAPALGPEPAKFPIDSLAREEMAFNDISIYANPEIPLWVTTSDLETLPNIAPFATATTESIPLPESAPASNFDKNVIASSSYSASVNDREEQERNKKIKSGREDGRPEPTIMEYLPEDHVPEEPATKVRCDRPKPKRLLSAKPKKLKFLPPRS